MEQGKDKRAMFVYGRFNPPTKGHEMMIQKMINSCPTNKCTPFIVMTKTQNKNKNPLSPNQKSNIMKKMFPNVDVIISSNPLQIVAKLRNAQYDPIAMMLGGNRINNFSWVKNVNKVSAGERNANNPISATLARAGARSGNITQFRKFMSNKLTNENLIGIMGQTKRARSRSPTRSTRTRTRRTGL
jgi:hypothetical protein